MAFYKERYGNETITFEIGNIDEKQILTEYHFYELYNESKKYERKLFIKDYGHGALLYENLKIVFHDSSNKIIYMVANQVLTKRQQSILGMHCRCDYHIKPRKCKTILFEPRADLCLYAKYDQALINKTVNYMMQLPRDESYFAETNTTSQQTIDRYYYKSKISTEGYGVNSFDDEKKLFPDYHYYIEYDESKVYNTNIFFHDYGHGYFLYKFLKLELFEYDTQKQKKYIVAKQVLTSKDIDFLAPHCKCKYHMTAWYNPLRLLICKCCYGCITSSLNPYIGHVADFIKEYTKSVNEK